VGVLLLGAWSAAACQEHVPAPAVQACQSYLNNSAANCSSSYDYSSYTAVKSYSCDLAGSGLQDVIAANSFHFECYTSSSLRKNSSGATNSSSSSSASAGPHCTVNFAVAASTHPRVSLLRMRNQGLQLLRGEGPGVDLGPMT
jgi:hypothetical protein